MAASSNFFRVKDEVAFRSWTQKLGLSVSEADFDGDKCFRISIEDNGDDDGWPLYYDDEENDESIDVDVYNELANYLQDGCVAILGIAGGMDDSAPYGHVEAVNNKGESVRINLGDIYPQAVSLGEVILF